MAFSFEASLLWCSRCCAPMILHTYLPHGTSYCTEIMLMLLQSSPYKTGKCEQNSYSFLFKVVKYMLGTIYSHNCTKLFVLLYMLFPLANSTDPHQVQKSLPLWYRPQIPPWDVSKYWLFMLSWKHHLTFLHLFSPLHNGENQLKSHCED